MPAYFIANYDIEDSKAHNDYVIAADSLLDKYGGKILAADENAKVIEGQGKMINVIVQFDSEETAMNFYNDPEYTSLKQVRLNATQNGTLVLKRSLPDTPE